MNAPLTADQQATHARAERQALVVQALLQVLPKHALLYTLEDTVPYELSLIHI
jgi:glycolate oxidase